MSAYVGMPVIYVPRPGRRETEMAALVTAVHSDDRCDLIIFPSMAESIQQPKVPMLSDKFTNHVWKVPDAMRVPFMVDVGGEALENMPRSPGHIVDAPSVPVEEVQKLHEHIAGLTERLAALEAKRGPGRPPNVAKTAAQENA